LLWLFLLVKESELEAASFKMLCSDIEGAIRTVFVAADGG
jgi:hypothetical protein